MERYIVKDAKNGEGEDIHEVIRRKNQVPNRTSSS